MFELEKSILEWKQAFRQRCSVDEASIEELESHLRESISELSRKGLSEEEGFIVAMKRLGHAPALDAEFKKNSPLGVNQERLIWMFSGYLGITLCGILSTAIISSLATGMLYAGWPSSVTGFVATLVEILFWIGVFILAVRESQVTLVIGKYPLLSLVAMFILMVALPFVSLWANMAQANFADTTWLADAYLWTGIGHFAVQLLIYAFCFVVLFKVRRSKYRLEVSQ